MVVIFVPFKIISPLSGTTEPFKTFNKVDLPAPLLPIIEIKSPSSIVKFNPLNTCFSVPNSEKKVLYTFFNSIIYFPSPLLIFIAFAFFLPFFNFLAVSFHKIIVKITAVMILTSVGLISNVLMNRLLL